LKEFETTLHFEFKDEKTAQSVNNALLPDNVRIPSGMKIAQIRNGSSLEINIMVDDSVSFETLISTIDELKLLIDLMHFDRH
jgi:tRNA threonylcarbamoyladenosine modification (KEOPS) complex  Pcc1 subunit